MSLTVQRARRRVEFCTNLALKADHEAAEAALRDAEREAARDARETGSMAARAAADRVAAIEAEMREHTVVFTLEALRRKEWTEFELAHPPRPDVEGDKAFGIDIASLDEVIARSIVSVTSLAGAPVDFDAAHDWAALADDMTDGQWQDFALAILNVNRGLKAAPFSAAASRQIRKSEPTSN